jgi:hypothetical protein
MLVPILVSVGSVGIGTMLAFVPIRRERVLRGLQLGAFGVALAAIVTHLMPEALEMIGGAALAVAGVAAVGPLAIERGLARFEGARRRGSVAMELGYAGLLLHRVTDGIGLWAYSEEALARTEVVVAIFLHEIPVTLVVVLGFLATHGRRQALLRASGLAASGIVGTVAASRIPPALVANAEPWLAAVVSGLLLDIMVHMVLHARRVASAPT